MRNPGKLLTLLMFVAAVSIALFAVWYNRRQSYRVAEAFSPRVVQLIAFAPTADAIRLEATGDGANDKETVQIDGRQYRVAGRHSAGEDRHFADVRHWLTHNDNYDWDSQPDAAAPEWEYLLQFSDKQDEVKLAFDLHHKRVMLLPNGAVLSTGPMIDGLTEFFGEQFPSAKPEERPKP